ncbi:MAG: hypothetical protein JXX29_20475 [Deltaproteobacteria bacterium]|nr:hypothetical protein [Deltaproteobacteria bacterium]MBN2674070.1 hypothetical protein [Deltaproteobacteria bacterium]
MIILFLSVCCGEENTATEPSDTSDDTASDSTVGSDSATDAGPQTVCGALFGSPNEQTGLDASQCQPSCDCGEGMFTPSQLTEAELDRLSAMELLNPLPPLTVDPYETPAAYVETPDKVCGLSMDVENTNAYRLETYDTADAASSAGAVITHYGACGLCSSLADLAVYMRYPDLTTPVRQCGIEGIAGGEDANMSCLLALGFSENCAQIWYYNTLNTRTLCLDVCAAALNAPYHMENGNINECLQCDEDNSGPVFKTVSGRTRRNSGLPTAICRPCETVSFVNHNYF